MSLVVPHTSTEENTFDTMEVLIVDEGRFRIDARGTPEYNFACMDEGTWQNTTEHRGVLFQDCVPRTFCSIEVPEKIAKMRALGGSIFVDRNAGLGRAEFGASPRGKLGRSKST